MLATLVLRLKWWYIIVLFLETIDEARKKLAKATETSNIDSDDEIQLRRKRKKIKFLIEDELTTENELNEETTILPMPPKYSN